MKRRGVPIREAFNQINRYEGLISELVAKYPVTDSTIIGEQNQKDFIALFGAVLRMGDK